ncbi:hypothetical protein K493DRAFT_410504 [Basidiobolus meristosporus CBS 931.73]|uniref:Uncharacterized protein n=1 Tax=Basidiobolus meristosporus CBS 931.73 TaxID=1314790 RepID=A0A1Y1XU88_9FUNG|nr:hypothetical protein K493DRAFT_410504 [Basidiobolus meristosporus CBS 931.73]|eukprot:ORX89319.1 hypothetical protein K493DRAFT_410504 [Basidiobolus meristosporus CBS 931.73]
MQESQVLYRASRSPLYVDEEIHDDDSNSTPRLSPSARYRQSYEEAQHTVFGHSKSLLLRRRNPSQKDVVTNTSNPTRSTPRTNEEHNPPTGEYSRVWVNSNSPPASAPKFGVVMDVFSVLMIVTVGFVMVF